MHANRLRTLTGVLFLFCAARLSAAPTINTQPVTANIVIGTGTSFNVAATTSGGTLTYQWQGSIDNGSTWSNIGNGPPFNNVTTATLAVNAPAAQYSGAKVRCAVTDTNGTTYTDGTASLNINTTAPLLILAQPTNKSAFQGDVATTDFKVLATGTGLTYQWQIATWNGVSAYTVFSDLSNSATYAGVTTNVLSITDPYGAFGAMTTNPNHYRCVVTNGGSYSINTRFASLNIYTTPANTASVAIKVNGSPASTIVSNDPSAITVQVSGIVSGSAVRIDRYLDLNGNGQIDFGEPLVQSFQVIDGNGAGANNTFGGVTDPNIPKDDDLTADGSVSASFTLAKAADLAKGAGAYIFRVSSQAGLFKTVDSSVFTVTQPALAHTVSGTVKDGANNPIPYAQVALLVNSGNNGPTVVNETVADGSGNFTLQAAPGQYNVLALASGYVTSFATSPTADTTSANVASLTINLTPANYINTVTLQDQVSGAPLRGVQVFFQSNSSNNIAIGNTDANGVVTGGALAEPDWSMDISSQNLGALGYLRPQSNNGIPLNTLVYVQGLRQANAMIYGTLTDNTTAPLANVGINASDQNNQYSADTTTDATGHYYLPVYGTGGSWNVQPDNSDPIFASNHNPIYIAPQGQFFSSVPGASATVANFVANVATATLSGTVTDADNSNSSLSGVQIDLYSVSGQNQNFVGSVQTGGDGSFSFGVSAGSWRIALDNSNNGNGPGFYVNSNNLVAPLLSFPSVVDNGNVTGIAYAVKHSTGTITGNVLDFGGAGISGANVSATATIGGVTYAANAQTNGSGAFSFPVIDGTWTINAFANNGLFFPPHNNVPVSGSVSGQIFQASVFTSNPGNHSVNAGISTNFSVGTNVPGSPTFRWDYSTDGGTTWNSVPNSAPYSGVASNNLNISSTTVSMNGYQYRLHVSFTYNSQPVNLDSAVGTLTVTATLPTFNFSPSPQTVNAGNNPSFGASVNGAPTPTLQWQVNSGSGWNNIADGAADAYGATYAGTLTNNLSVNNADFSLNGYQYRVVATNTAGSANSNAATLTVNRNSQFVSFSGNGNATLNSPITLSPSVGSGLTAFNFSVTGTPTATYNLTGNSLTLTSAGSVTVQATQPGDNYYAPASNTATFTVQQQPVTVIFNNLSQTYDGTPKSVSVTTNPPGVSNSVTYNAVPTPPTNAGSYTVAVNITDSNYYLSGSGSNTLTINPASQSINFAGLADQTYRTTSIPLTATATSGLSVTFSIQGGPANVSGNQLTLTGLGSVTVRASQSGNGNYGAAPNVDRTFNVTKGAATVALGNLNAPYDGNPHSATAATNPNGLTVGITYNGSGTPPTNAGTYAVVATINDTLYQGSARSFYVIAPPAGPGTEAIDASFTRPQFRRTSVPERLVVDQVTGSGKTYALWENGNTVTGVNNQRLGPIVRLNADGSVDPSFAPGAILSDAWIVVPLANGQVLVGGLASNENYETGIPNFRVFRLNNDGSVDYTYSSPVFAQLPRFMTLQSDGRLLVVPGNNSVPNGGITALVRLNTDGSLDNSFTSPVFDVQAGNPNFIFSNMLVDASGRIYIGGTFTTVNGIPRLGLARLNVDGTLDNTFVPSGYSFIGTTANSNDSVRALGFQTQGANAGKLLVAGKRLTVSAINRQIIRLKTDGSLDNSFSLVAPGSFIGANGTRARVLTVMPNDKFYIISDSVTRFNADGSMDGSYTRPIFNQEAYWMDMLADGTVLVPLEYATTVNGSSVPSGPVRFTPSGSLDGSFNPGTFQTEVYPGNFAIQPDGRVLAWGNFDTVNTTARHGMARINTDGSLDSFDLSGVANLYSVQDATLLPNGQILAATLLGTYQNSQFSTLTNGASRFNSNGTVDNTFTLDPSANPGSLHVLPDGHILSWDSSPQAIANGGLLFKRLTADGAVDNTFTGLGSTAFGAVYRDGTTAITQIVQGQFQIAGHYADGRTIALATVPNDSYPQNAASLNFTVLRLKADGTIDSSFTAPVVSQSTTFGFTNLFIDPLNIGDGPNNYPLVSPTGSPFAGAIPQADGSVIVYGAFTNLGGNPAPGIARLTNLGAFDNTFNVGTGAQLLGLSGRTAQVEHIDVAPNGQYWVTGLFDTMGGSAAAGLARLNADGSVDSTLASAISYRPYLGNGTKTGFGPSGEVVLAGTFAQAFEPFPFGISRLVGTVAPAITTQPQSQSVTAGANVTFSVGVTSGLTVAYQWFFNNVAITGATNSTLTLTNVQNANAGNYTVTATNAVSLATSNIAALTLGPTFASWQTTNFTSGELGNTSISGPNAVYGQDGLPNLVKYALGLNPKQNITTGLPVVSTSGANWTYTYTRPTNITDVTYNVQYSTDLVSWTSLGAGTQLSSISGTDTWQATYPLASAPRIFYRLQVTQP